MLHWLFEGIAGFLVVIVAWILGIEATFESVAIVIIYGAFTRWMGYRQGHRDGREKALKSQKNKDEQPK